MKRHKHKPYIRHDPEPCTGCQWNHDLFGVCCNPESKQRDDVSERCELYVAGEPVPGVQDREDN